MYRGAGFSDIEPGAFVATFPCNGNQSGRGSEANFPAEEGRGREGAPQPTAYFGHAVAEVAPCITLYVVKEYHLPSLVVLLR